MEEAGLVQLTDALTESGGSGRSLRELRRLDRTAQWKLRFDVDQPLGGLALQRSALLARMVVDT